MRRALLGAAVVLAALLGGGPAAAVAHPLLVQASPTPGIVAQATPQSITLALSEPAVARGSKITVTDARGRRVATGPVRGSDGGRTLSVTPRTRLGSAVYDVRWSALGDDGHLVSGRFDFGVPGAKGAPPAGAEKLGGVAAGGRGGENAVGDGVVNVIGRWLGILAASLLAGGFALVAALRRRTPDAPDGADAARGAAPVVWALLALGAVEGVLAAATASAGGGLDFGLLPASGTGVAALVRIGVVLVVGAALLVVSRRPWAGTAEDPRDDERVPLSPARVALRDRLYGAGGVLALLSYGLSGHVLSDPSALALVEQAVHVLAAGLWLGGVIALVVLNLRGGVRLLDGARAFAPIAGAALALAVVTGVLDAVREVDGWYFLRWTDYGRIVIVKAALVALVSLAGLAAYLRSRGDRGPRRGLLRAEALGVVAVLALAATLSGLAQGRGQPLPAERGTLFAGPAFATAIVSGGGADVALAPARAGANVLTVSTSPESSQPREVSVRLACACDARPVRTTLSRRGGATWSAPVRLPRDGAWYGYVTVDGKQAASPVSLSVGVPSAPGSTPREVLAVADLTGPDGDRCAKHEMGLQMAVARINADGGLDGGHKVVLRVLDSGGSAARAAQLARGALAEDRPVALAGACGAGGEGAVDVAGRAGVPSIVGDPAVAPTNAPGSFRLASDPYAQGLAFGAIIATRVVPTRVAGTDTVRAVVGRDAAGQRLLAGLRTGLKGSPLKLAVLAPGAFARESTDALAKTVGRASTAAIVVDGPRAGGSDANAIARVGRDRERLAPAPILASERVLSEDWVRSAGSLGRLGAMQGVSEVSPTTADGTLYQQAVPVLFPGAIASLDGLRGYVTGLALIDAVERGTSPSALRAKLAKPDVFSNALLAPWQAAQPGAGAPNVVALQPQFLSTTLVPPQFGGEAQDTTYFPQGSWTVTSGTALGVSAKDPAPKLDPKTR